MSGAIKQNTNEIWLLLSKNIFLTAAKGFISTSFSQDLNAHFKYISVNRSHTLTRNKSVGRTASNEYNASTIFLGLGILAYQRENKIDVNINSST